MSSSSRIEWTDATWNPVVGCTVVSPGCTNCYAMKQAARMLDGNPKAPHYEGTTRQVNGAAVWTGKVAMAPGHIVTAPLRWKKPRRIFVNSMGDLFHESVPDEWIDRVFAVMGAAPQHTYQVLTKRSRRMRDYIVARKSGKSRAVGIGFGLRSIVPFNSEVQPPGWIWIGVSAEDQARADARIPDLLATPAAVRFVSAEPLLGPVDLANVFPDGRDEIDALSGFDWDQGGYCERLDWVIAGGESGPGARPMHPTWVRALRDQCAKAGVPFFFKQMSGPVKSRMPAIPADLIAREFPHAKR